MYERQARITCYKQDEHSTMESLGALDWRFESCLRTLIQSGRVEYSSTFCCKIAATKMLLDHLWCHCPLSHHNGHNFIYGANGHIKINRQE